MFNTSSGHQQIAEAIQQMWKDNLGLDVKLTNQEWQVYLETIRDPEATPQIYRLGWCQDYPDANNFIREVFVKGGSANPTAGGGVNYEQPDLRRAGCGRGPRAGPGEARCRCTPTLKNCSSRPTP